MMPQCGAAQKYDQLSVPENVCVISLITNSKILPYTVQGLCHIIDIPRAMDRKLITCAIHFC